MDGGFTAPDGEGDAPQRSTPEASQPIGTADAGGTPLSTAATEEDSGDVQRHNREDAGGGVKDHAVGAGDDGNNVGDGDDLDVADTVRALESLEEEQVDAIRLGLLGVQARARGLEVLDGVASVEDSPGRLLLLSLKHHLHVVALALAAAALMVPVVWYHAWMHHIYLEEWESVPGTDTRNGTGLLGYPEMFKTDADSGLYWIWTLTFSFFGTTNLLCVSVIWLFIINGYDRLPRTVNLLTVGITIVFTAYIMGGYALVGYAEWLIPQFAFNIIPFLSAALFAAIAGYLLRKKLRFPTAGKVLAAQVLVNALIFYLYTEHVPRWFLESDEVMRAVIRLVVHPILVECILGTMRLAALHYPPHLEQAALVIFLLPTYIVSNLLGRFLVAASSSLTVMIALSIALSGQELALRLTVPWRMYWYVRLTGADHVTATKFVSSQRARRMKADALAIDMLCEDFGIVIAPVIIWFYRLTSRGLPPPTADDLASSAALQLGVELLTDMMPAVVIATASWLRLRRRARRVQPSATPVAEIASESDALSQREHDRQHQRRSAASRYRDQAIHGAITPPPLMASPAARARTIDRRSESAKQKEANMMAEVQNAIQAVKNRKHAMAAKRRFNQAPSSGAASTPVASPTSATFGGAAAVTVGHADGGRRRPLTSTASGRLLHTKPIKRFGDLPMRATARIKRMLTDQHTQMQVTGMLLDAALVAPSLRNIAHGGEEVDKHLARLGPQFEAALSRAEDALKQTGRGRTTYALSSRTGAELPRQIQTSAWVTAPVFADGRTERHVAISEVGQDDHDAIDLIEAVIVIRKAMKWLNDAVLTDYLSALKRDNVNFINAYESRFRWYETVFIFYCFSWLEYYLRFFCFPAQVMCAQRLEDGWQFQPCT